MLLVGDDFDDFLRDHQDLHFLQKKYWKTEIYYVMSSPLFNLGLSARSSAG
jgi:hypothetical protein